MGLGRKTFLILAVTNLVALTILLLVSERVISREFNSLETAGVNRNIARLMDAIDADHNQLLSKNGDWAIWDDPYLFTQDLNQEFIDTNQTNNSFVQLQLTAMVFYNQDGKLVHKKMVIDGREVELPTGILQKLNTLVFPKAALEESLKIFLRDQGHLYMVTGRPILSSDNTGPNHGTLFFIKEIESNLVNALSEITHNQTMMAVLPTTDVATDIQASLIASDELTAIRRFNDQTISGYLLTKDQDGLPIAIWQINLPRDIYAQGQRTIRSFATFFIGSGLATGLVLMYLLYHFLLRRLLVSAKITNSLRSDDLTIRLPDQGEDEISSLNKAFNNLLERLDHALITSDADRLKLRTERDKLNIMFRSMGEGVVILDEKLNVSAINPVGAGILNVKAQELLSKPWYQVVQVFIGDKPIEPKDRLAIKSIETGETIQVKLDDDRYFATAGRKKFPIISSTSTFRDGDSLGVVITFQDATHQKDVQARIEQQVIERTRELHEVEAKLVSSIKELEVGFIMTDAKQQIVMVNDAAMKALHSADEPAGLDTSDGIHIATIENIAKTIIGKCDLIKELKTAVVEKKKITINNIAVGHKDLQIFISPILLESKPIGAVVLLVDTTVAKQLDRAKDDFLSIASHELRTPLTAIMGNVSMIEQYFSPKIKDEDFRSMVGDMKLASQRLIDLVNDFLNVSRLEQGRIVIKPEKFSLTQLTRGVVSELQPSAKNKVKITMANSTDQLVYADPLKTKEIIINLLGNAIKYSRQGTINLSWQADKYVTFRVSDTGIGIDPKDQLRLFQKFQQAGNSSITRDTTRSSGLGLYISRLLAESMGGEVGLEKSVPGKGSTFYLKLPIDKTSLNKD